MLSVAELSGLWTRSLIAWPDGRRDVTTRVRWMQGVNAYIDLRQPAALPAFSHACALDDLTFEDCLALAAQEGFAGQFGADGGFFEWVRVIDYQPKTIYSDSGSLIWEGDVLVERGRDVDYIEHWHRDNALPASPVAAFSLRCVETGVLGAMLRVGRHFMFARNRAVVPGGAQRLAACVAGAADVAAARALIDCEISFGDVGPGGLTVTASTLPYRVGADVTPSPEDARLRVAGRLWDITSQEGDAQNCFFISESV